MEKWSIVDDGDPEFTGEYDVWIAGPTEEGCGTIIGACWREHAPLISAAPELRDALDGAIDTIDRLIKHLGMSGRPGLADQFRPYLASYRQILALSTRDPQGTWMQFVPLRSVSKLWAMLC